MSTNTKRLIIFVIILLILSLALNFFFRSGPSIFGGFNKNISPRGTNTFPVNGSFSKIEVESKTGDIRFHNAGRGSAKVVWSGSSVMKLDVLSRGDTLKITENYRLPWFLRFGIHLEKSVIDVHLPEKDYKSLNVGSGTGSITVPTGFTFGDAKIETDTGSIDFQADVRDNLKIESDTGRISCAGVKAKNVEISSDTGSLNVSSLKASEDIKLKTDTGRISLSNVIAEDNLEIKSDTGSVSLDRCDAGELEIKTDTGSISGTLLTEKTFNVKSGTGKINVPSTTFGGPCIVRTDTGSITISIER